MKLAGTLLVKNEIDVIGPWLEFHRDRFDVLYVTDNDSMDGTREYLETVPDIQLIDENGDNYDQKAWVDRMVRMAIADGAEWVVNSDVDEFWIGDFQKTIEKHRATSNLLAVRSWIYRPTEADDPREANPIKRVVYRDPDYSREFTKAPHAAEKYSWVYTGNHDVFFEDGHPKVWGYPSPDELRIAHFSCRGWEHFRKKYIVGGEAYTRSTLPKNYGYHWRDVYDVYLRGGTAPLRDLYEDKFLIPEADLWKLRRDPILT